MIFADLDPGESIFLDANTLVYHFAAHAVFGSACTQLVQRIENQELFGLTSTHVLGEAAHRLMTIEASNLFGWPFVGIGNRLRTHPVEVRKLTAFRQATDHILQSSVQVLAIPPGLLATGAVLSQQVGLLTNDALVVAVMLANGLNKIASNDADFDRVSSLRRYAPV